MNVVFTGPAYDQHGTAVLREELVSACSARGNITVQSSVKASTDVLVASRTDTVKAMTAAQRGVKVLTYPDFIERFLLDVEFKGTGALDPFVDVVDKAISGYIGPMLPAFDSAKKFKKTWTNSGLTQVVEVEIL